MIGDPELDRRTVVEHQYALACSMASAQREADRPQAVAIGDVARAWAIAMQTTESYLRSLHVLR